MDWTRCDEIEYDNQYENGSMFHTGKKDKKKKLTLEFFN